MLLKAGILHRGGRIREKRANETIGVKSCIRRALSDGTIKFITEEQALALQNINDLRDAAQHHLLDISENQLYMHAQAGLTLFRDLLKQVFNRDICDLLPNRVLPLTTSAPMNLEVLFDSETSEIVKLLQPGSRKRLEAQARLRPLAILDTSMQGKEVQPNAGQLNRIGKELAGGRKWQDVFPGVASMEITTSGAGPSFSLRWTKKEGAPIHVVPEGTPGATVVAVKRVNELDFYNLSITQIAENVGLTSPKTVAMVRYLEIEKDNDCFKKIRIGKSEFKRYSQKTIGRIREELKTVSIGDVWKTHGPRKRKVTN
jgi:AraC-like DNA-binding protein